MSVSPPLSATRASPLPPPPDLPPEYIVANSRSAIGLSRQASRNTRLIRAARSHCEVGNRAREGSDSQFCLQCDVEIEAGQQGSQILRVVDGVGQPGGVLVRAVADDQSHPLVGE